MSNFTDILHSDFEHEVLLNEYYKHEIKAIFIDGKSLKKEEKNFTLYMIPNKETCLNNRLEQIQTKMKIARHDIIEFKMIGDYIKMTEEEIDHHLKYGYLDLAITEFFNDQFSDFYKKNLAGIIPGELYKDMLMSLAKTFIK